MSDILPERNLILPEGLGAPRHTYSARDLGLLVEGEIVLSLANTEIVELGSFSRKRVIEAIGNGQGRELAMPDAQIDMLQSQGFPSSFYPSLAVYKIWQSGKGHTPDQLKAIVDDSVEIVDPITGELHESHYLNTRIRTVGSNWTTPHHIEIWRDKPAFGGWTIVSRILAEDCMQTVKSLGYRMFPWLSVPDLGMDKRAFEWYVKRIEAERPEAA